MNDTDWDHVVKKPGNSNSNEQNNNSAPPPTKQGNTPDPFAIKSKTVKVISLEDDPSIPFNTREALEDITTWGIPYRVFTPHHIKIANINYYPSKGSIFKDGADGRYQGTGLAFLKEVLRREGHL